MSAAVQVVHPLCVLAHRAEAVVFVAAQLFGISTLGNAHQMIVPIVAVTHEGSSAIAGRHLLQAPEVIVLEPASPLIVGLVAVIVIIDRLRYRVIRLQ